MEKAAVIYWSGSGNTEAMANEICDGIKAGGMDCEIYNVSDFKGNIADYSKIALGCRLWVMRFWKKVSLSLFTAV